MMYHFMDCIRTGKVLNVGVCIWGEGVPGNDVDGILAIIDSKSADISHVVTKAIIRK